MQGRVSARDRSAPRRRRRARRAARVLILLAVSVGLVAAWLAFDRWVDATVLPPLTPEVSAEVVARDGRLLRAYTVGDGRWRLRVDEHGVDARYIAMLLAYEDGRFYQHPGVDVVALARSAYQSLLAGHVVAGGSTITMQVARLLEEGATGSWSGKLRQIRVALALERVLSKEEVLALYLQLAPMGGNLEGVRAGSLAWFGKEPARLTEAEAALLVALPQAPATRAPDLHPTAAAAARQRVLLRAAEAGVIADEAALAALTEPLPAARLPFMTLAPHLADRLRAEDPDAGLQRTTLDADLQAAMERLAAAALVDLPPRVTVALLVADVDSGEVLADVGSADYTSTARLGYVDMTTALRSPGSTLKPLVYGMAFSDGIAQPETLMNDRPEDYGGYAPQNFDGVFRGPVTAREALQTSLNLPVVALTEALGPARLLASLRAAGVEAVVPGDTAGLAVALGGVGVSLEGLVQLYAAIARGGEARPLQVRAGEAAVSGAARPLEGGEDPAGDTAGAARLMTPAAAWQVADILAGAPRPARLPDWPLAFKTGTSHGNRDALAIGFDGDHVVGVWVGRADGTPVPGMLGVEVAAPILFDAFAYLGGPTPLPGPPPGTPRARTTGELPVHLRRFGSRDDTVDDAPRLTFPPDGAVLAPMQGGVPARVERGEAPFTWFANGEPMVVGSYEREVRLELPTAGFVTLAVVDGQGRAARVSVELR